MPYGYTKCKYCSKIMPNRLFKIHLQTCCNCPDTERPTLKEPKEKKPKKVPKIDLPEIIVPEKPEMKDWDEPRCDTTILEKSEKIQPKQELNKGGRPKREESKYKNPLFAENMPIQKATRRDLLKNPYNIATGFIKHQIEDGSISFNLPQLLNDGRATIKRHKQIITIEIDLAKFRHNLNKGEE